MTMAKQYAIMNTSSRYTLLRIFLRLLGKYSCLKQAEEEVKEFVLINLSQRVRAFIEGRMKASESIVTEKIESVQKKILEITTIEAEKVVEKVRSAIVTVREQMIQIYQSEQ